MIQFRLYERNGGALLGLLGDMLRFDVGIEFNEIGALRFEYPIDGANASSIAALREIAAIDDAGNEIKNGRFVITDISQDRTSAQPTLSVSAKSILWRLDTALAYPDGGVNSGEISRFFDTASAGQVMKTLIDDAVTRGALSGITYDFTALADSKSNAWPDSITQEYPARSSLLSVFRSLSDYGLCEIETNARKISLCLPDKLGTDKTTGNSPIVLRTGLSVFEAPEQINADSVAGVALVEGDEGVILERTNTAGVTTYGRLETSFAASGIADPLDLGPLADSYLTDIAAPSRQITVGLTLQSEAPQPFVDFNVGDFVYTSTSAGLEKVRVRQITYSMSDGKINAAATLGDRIFENAIRTNRRIAALTSGSVILGNGQIPSITPTTGTDTIAPSAPTGLTGSSAVYFDGSTARARVTLTWTAPTTNADASALTDLTGYEVYIRKLATDPWEFAGATQSATATLSQLEPGTAYLFAVTALDQFNNRSAFSTSFAHTTATSSTFNTSSTPSTPTVTSRLGTLSVSWNGLNSAGGAMPVNFSYVLVHASTTNNFTPSTANVVGRMNGADTVVLSNLTYSVTYYIKLVAYSTTGIASSASAQASASIQPLVNTDLIAKSLTTWPFLDGTVDVNALASGSVSASKLIDGAVTTAKISAGAIGADQIAANAIVAGKIAANAVTAGTIAALAISAGNIQANAITADKIEAGAITTAKLNATAIDGMTITGSTVRTSSGSNRVEMNSSGLFVYSAGSPVVSLNASGTASFTGSITATGGKIGNFNIMSGDYLQYGTTILYGASSSGSYSIIDNSRAAAFNSIFASGTQFNAISTSGGAAITGGLIVSGNTTLGGSTTDISYLSVGYTAGIVGGYGVVTDWSPNVDNTRTVGQSAQRWVRVWAVNSTISTSDARLKTDIQTASLGLDFIKSLRPVSYKWIVGAKDIKLDENGEPIVTGQDANGKPIYELETRPGVRRHWGFIAQEVKEAVEASGVEDFAGFVQDDLSDPDSSLSLSYEQFIAPMAKAIQELAAKVEALEESNRA